MIANLYAFLEKKFVIPSLILTQINNKFNFNKFNCFILFIFLLEKIHRKIMKNVCPYFANISSRDTYCELCPVDSCDSRMRLVNIHCYLKQGNRETN